VRRRFKGRIDDIGSYPEGQCVIAAAWNNSRLVESQFAKKPYGYWQSLHRPIYRDFSGAVGALRG